MLLNNYELIDFFRYIYRSDYGVMKIDSDTQDRCSRVRKIDRSLGATPPSFQVSRYFFEL